MPEMLRALAAATTVVVTLSCAAPTKTKTTRKIDDTDDDCFYGCTSDAKRRASQPSATSELPRGLHDPATEQAQILRDAADMLDKARAALERGDRNRAELLFSTAELLVGADLLAPMAPSFRAGAPPRVTAPPHKVDVTAPRQPAAVGNTEADDDAEHVPPPRLAGSLHGTLKIDGRVASGAFGLITLEPLSGTWKPRTPKHLVIEQRGREFSPHLIAVSVGSTVSFPNFDPLFHNVFSTSPLNPFDLGLYKLGEAREVTFEHEGIARIGCNLHANMSAYVAVVADPAYVVTDDKGSFAFRHVKPGTYKLKAWSERSRAPITQQITIKPGPNEVNPSVTGDGPTGPQPDKFGGKRTLTPDLPNPR